MAAKTKKRRKLNPRERKFLSLYFSGTNPYQAALKAGYSPNTSKAHSAMWVGANRKLSRNKTLWDAASERRLELEAKYKSEESRILREYNRLAYFDIRKLYDKSGKLKNIVDLDDDTAAALVGLDVKIKAGKPDERDVILKYKMADKKGALDSLSKIKGMFAPNRIEILGSAVNDALSDLTPEERDLVLQNIKKRRGNSDI